MPMSRAVLALPLCISVACGGERTPITPTTPDGSPLPTFRLSGIVADDEGRPVAGVEVTVSPAGFSGREIRTITDSTGAYFLQFGAAPTSSGRVAGVAGTREGYERSFKGVFAAANETDLVGHLRMRRSLTVTAGESIEVVVDPEDNGCWEEFVCRRVRVRMPQAGLITVSATSSTGAEVCMEVIRLGAGRIECTSFSSQLSAGEEIVVAPLLSSPATHSERFTLRTSVEP